MEIDKINALGSDAQSSQFEIYFPEGLYDGDSGDDVAFRVEGTFQVPREIIESYEFFYRGMKFPRLSMVDGTDKTLTFDTIRIDGNWEVYNKLARWQKAGFDPNNATRDSFINTNKIIGLRALDEQNSTRFNLNFMSCQVKELEITAFDHAGTEPLKISATMIYAKKVII